MTRNKNQQARSPSSLFCCLWYLLIYCTLLYILIVFFLQHCSHSQHRSKNQQSCLQLVLPSPWLLVVSSTRRRELQLLQLMIPFLNFYAWFMTHDTWWYMMHDCVPIHSLVVSNSTHLTPFQSTAFRSIASFLYSRLPTSTLLSLSGMENPLGTSRTSSPDGMIVPSPPKVSRR